ncbi:DVUA0089 family protein [Pseudaeromonas paramecii]|uniref:Ice-binding protein C-terminal domain-containing protein n=1 Tax=Pseudaeromonas paramecii TaxID=2138166 RepID=A0ABP8Q487_9GAMM
MKKTKLGIAALLAMTGTLAQASVLDFSGTLSSDKDVAQISFTALEDLSNVLLWTDSYSSGTNLDPVLTLWSQLGDDWQQVAYNDDNSSIASGQTSWDSGLSLSSLSAGNYLLTLSAFPNFANGNLLSQGYNYDSQTSTSWTLNGTPYWQAHISAEGAITAAVPEPETYALGLLGLGALLLQRRRQKLAA